MARALFFVCLAPLAAAIIPYRKGTPGAACPAGEEVLTKVECLQANAYLRINADGTVQDKRLQDSGKGCVIYDNRVMWFNQIDGSHSHDTVAVCKGPDDGNTTTTTTTGSTTRATRPPILDPNCGNSYHLSDGQCDPANNNVACGWDRKDIVGTVSDCCLGTAYSMDGCSDTALCKCLDPNFDPALLPSTTTTTAATTPTPTTAATTASTAAGVATTKAAAQTTAACDLFLAGDGVCDAKYNTAQCNYDKKDGKPSDCCAGDTSSCGTSAMCKCLDPTYKAPATTTASATSKQQQVTQKRIDGATTSALWALWCGLGFAALAL